MKNLSFRVPLVTLLTFLIALVVSYQVGADKSLILSIPTSLLFGVGCSVFLVVYYAFEFFIARKEL